MRAVDAKSITYALDLHRAGRLDETEAAYLALLNASPHHPDLLRLLGLLRFQQGRADEALALLEQSVAAHPDFLDARRALAVVLGKSGRWEEALAQHSEAARLAPDDASVLNDFGCALLEAGRLEDAAEMLRLSVDLDHEHGEALTNLAAVLNRLGRAVDAADGAKQAAALRPDHAGVLGVLSTVLASNGDYAGAEQAARRAVALSAEDSGAWIQLGNVLIDIGEVDAAAEAYGRAVELAPDNRVAAHNRLYALHLSATVGDEGLFEAIRRWGVGQSKPIVLSGWDRDPDRRLRIGYVSADFGQHPVGWFMAPVLPNHDPTEVEVVCYSHREVEDDLTRLLRNHCQDWVSVLGMDDRALAERIRADGIDLLIDLGGHTARNRLETFAMAPAPVQATWGGLIGTTGLPAMGWLIGDPQQVPPGAEGLYTECIVRLPNGYVCYGPPDYAPEVTPLPALRNGWQTFGCFNRLAKLSDETLVLWARVLEAVPESRLVLNTKELACPVLRERVAGRFAGLGIGADRLDLRPGGSHVEMLAAYGDVDVALDPMPYSGGLTTLEALWMGVPVVTLPGRRFCARHSLSHVTVLGYPEWVASDPDGYVRIVAGLAQHTGYLEELRAGMRARMAASPLCDGAAFTRDLEAAYREMWRQYCAT
ncbi:putative O-linked N-acetylglucosamine transferase (SPINDLY family) [Skermanella aerolata]|uniref:O-linked N-acetylglucosamine transferase, SPINDLY family protein n=1 Tax=Skermanella aerolata TaxID=393310 RepID=UPI003D1C6724